MDVKIITPPDHDYTNKIKLLLVDFVWEEVERYSHIFTEIEEDITIYVLHPDVKAVEWTLLNAHQASAILVNCNERTSNEMLKGYLLSFKNAAAYGMHDQTLVANETYHDISVWFTKVAQKFNLVKPNWQE